jgi:regulatory protein
VPAITDIKQQRRRQTRYSIYLDGRYSFSLGESELVSVGLRVGDELTPDRVAELGNLADMSKALDRVYNFLSYRERSRQEVQDYLRRKGYEEPMSQSLIERLEENNLLNDERFAVEWVAARQQGSPRSLTQLRLELRQKGIAGDTIEAVLSQQSPEVEVGSIVQLIEQKRLLQRYAERPKLIQYLLGKGFRFAAIQAALEQLEEI